MTGRKIAIGRQLQHCQGIVTLGIKHKLTDYPESDAKLIYNADKIYYPSFFLYKPLRLLGKKTFPNPNYYEFFCDKIKQTRLFFSLGIRHPRTRVYFFREEKKRILQEWAFPFIAKIPRRSSFGMGVYLIHNRDDLDTYNKKTDIAYIQEYLHIDRDIRIVLINKRILLSYWRLIPEGEYRSNVLRGGKVSFDSIPRDALDFARKVVELCDFDNVGLDICKYAGEYYVFEANMGYGIEGFRQAGLEYKTILKEMVENDEI